jgi:hypothetical protein
VVSEIVYPRVNQLPEIFNCFLAGYRALPVRRIVTHDAALAGRSAGQDPLSHLICSRYAQWLSDVTWILGNPNLAVASQQSASRSIVAGEARITSYYTWGLGVMNHYQTAVGIEEYPFERSLLVSCLFASAANAGSCWLNRSGLASPPGCGWQR